MLDPEISGSIRELIQRHLATMDHIEVLMVLRGAREDSFSAQQIAGQIRKPEKAVQPCLESLVRSGLVALLSNQCYRYAPRDEDLDEAAGAVIKLYNERPVTLVKLLYERPPTAVNTFADAFRLRKD